MNTFSKATAILLLAAVATLPVAAQLSVTVEDVSVPEAARQTVTFDSVAIGQRATKRLYLQFDAGGSRTVVLDRIQVVGTNQFSVETDDTLPVTLRNQFRYAILVHYEPSTPGPAYGQLQVTTEREDDTGVVTKLSSVNLVGRVPDFSLRYSLPGGSPIAVPTGGIIDFGRKSTNIATEATLVITNVGSVAGTVQSVRLTGGGFRLVSPPSIPFRLAAGQEQILQLAFTPTATRGFSGRMTLDWGGTPRVVDITGIGGDLLSYRLVTYARGSASGAPRDIQSGTSIVFGQNANVIELIGRNLYANAQSVEAARITGPFTFTARPSLPATLGPREEFVVQLSPARTARGSDTGTLTIGDAIFPLSLDVPSMPPVQYSRQGGAVSEVQDIPLGLSLATPYPVDIAGTLTLDFRGSMQGAAAVAWATGGRTAEFTIPAGQRAAVFPGGSTSLAFQTGVAAGEISVQARFAADPWGIDITPISVPELKFTVDIDPLPAVQFSRQGGTVGAGESVSLGLGLAAPYGADLVGALVLVAPGNDPSVAWATGGREAMFRITAGAREATFAGGSAALSFNAGGSAGEITVRARLSTDNPRVDVTPATTPELRFSVDLAPLPEVRFSRTGGIVSAGQEVSLGLSLAAPYGSELSGTLQLRSPAGVGVSWVAGGTAVQFTIPAGQTAAAFSGGASEVTFRTGRVAGWASVQARFATEPAQVDVTPVSVPELRFSVELDPLPEVMFSEAGGTASGGGQISLGLTLAKPYPTDIAGFLELRFETRAFTTDPAIQWASGGRLAAFGISAGSTEAAFLDLGTTNAFQTGTVAGDIVVTAQLYSVPDVLAITTLAQAQAVAADITPSTAPQVRFRVMEGAPVLSRVDLGTTGQGRFNLQITGYATTRSVESMSFAFSGTVGSLLRTPDLEADVSQAFTTFYGGNQSASFGSQFTATVQFSLDEGVFEDVAQVTVTASNSEGTSNSVTLNLN